jgi:hypothetical protein
MFGVLKVIVDEPFKQIDVDSSSNSLVCGVSPDNEIFCSNIDYFTVPEWTKKEGVVQQISLNGKKAVAISPTNEILYNPSFTNENTTNWVKLSAGRNFSQIDYNGNVACAIGSDKFVYCTDNLDASNNTPIWIKLFGGYEQVAVYDKKLYAINSNNELYYSTTYNTTLTPWTLIPGKLKKISFNENNIAGIDLSENIVYGTANATNPNWDIINITGTTKYSNVSFNKDRIYATSTDNKLYENFSNYKLCRGTELETKNCIDYCNIKTVNCDAPLKEYCSNNTNPNNKLCACFKPEQFYTNVKLSITKLFDGNFTNTNNYCYFNDCRDATIKPFNFKNNINLCNDDSSCFIYNSNSVDNSGNLTNIEISKQSVCSNVIKKGTSKSRNLLWLWILIGVIVFIVIISLIVWFAYRKKN